MGKAIQVKYVGPTNHLGARFKVMAEGAKPRYYSRGYEDGHSLETEVEYYAHQFALFEGWFSYSEFKGFHVAGLPNGDWALILKR